MTKEAKDGKKSNPQIDQAVIPKSSYKKLLNQAPTMPMLFSRFRSAEVSSLQLGSDISKDLKETARIIPKITKNKFNKSTVSVLVAELSEKAGLKIFENRDDLFLVNFSIQRSIISVLTI